MSDAMAAVQAAQDHPGGAIGLFIALIGAAGVVRRTESAHTKADAQALQIAALTKRMDDADGKLADTVGTAVRHHVEAALPVLIPGAAVVAVRAEFSQRFQAELTAALAGRTLPVDPVALAREIAVHLGATHAEIAGLRRDVERLDRIFGEAQKDGGDRWAETRAALADLLATLRALDDGGGR